MIRVVCLRCNRGAGGLEVHAHFLHDVMRRLGHRLASVNEWMPLAEALDAVPQPHHGERDDGSFDRLFPHFVLGSEVLKVQPGEWLVEDGVACRDELRVTIGRTEARRDSETAGIEITIRNPDQRQFEELVVLAALVGTSESPLEKFEVHREEPKVSPSVIRAHNEEEAPLALELR